MIIKKTVVVYAGWSFSNLYVPFWGNVHLGFFFFFSSRRRHTRLQGDWSSDVCSSDLASTPPAMANATRRPSTLVRVKIVSPGCTPDRKSVVQGKSVDLGGRRIIKK